MNQKEVGKRIKLIRESKGLTREELARKLNVVERTIANYEQGQRGSNTNTLDKIAKALGVSVIDILYPTNEDKEKAVAEAQDILKQEFYDKPAAETLVFLLGQITDTRLKSIYSEKLKNNELNSKEIQLLIEELAKILEYILYKMNTRDK